MNQFSIKMRLIMGFSMIVVLFFGFVRYVYKSFVEVDERLDVLTDDVLKVIVQVNAMDRCASDRCRATGTALLMRDISKMPE